MARSACFGPDAGPQVRTGAVGLEAVLCTVRAPGEAACGLRQNEPVPIILVRARSKVAVFFPLDREATHSRRDIGLRGAALAVPVGGVLSAVRVLMRPAFPDNRADRREGRPQLSQGGSPLGPGWWQADRSSKPAVG
ncbi:hypothetical protein GCM10028775_54990 [Catellatospora paridis]